jgi:signal transduction histidine kinase
MRIMRDLVIAFVVAVSVIFAVHGWMSYRRTTAYFEADARREVHALGHAISAAVSRTWEEDGAEQALRLIGKMNEPGTDLRVRWVWLTGEPGAGHAPTLSAAEILGAGSDREVVRYQKAEAGEERLLTYFRLAPEPGHVGALEISESMARKNEFTRASLRATAGTLVALVLVCGGVLTALGVWLVGRPLRALLAMARRIGEGDLTAHLDLRRRDEVSDLGEEMNQMCTRLAQARERIVEESAARVRTLDQLRHADRLNTVGTLAAGIAHELGSPLQVVFGRARQIATSPGCPPAIVPQAAAIAEQAERMSAIIRQLLDFARRRTLQTGSFDVGAVVGQTVDLLSPLAHRRGVALAFSLPGQPLPARIDAAQIQQAITNLIVNAVQAGGAVTVEAGRGPALAATNQNLEALVKARRFRDDLYYRLDVVPVAVPPLRARGDDTLLLAQRFIERFAARAGKPIRGLSAAAAEKLLAYDWPGNVRELQNWAERAVTLAVLDEIGVDDLPPKIRDHRPAPRIDDAAALTLAEVERRHVLRVLQSTGGNRTATARVLGLDRTTLWRKLERYAERDSDERS